MDYITRQAPVGLLLVLCVCSNTQAVELSAILSTEVEYNNNIGLSTTDTVEEVDQILALDLGFFEERKNFQVDASVRLDKEYYYSGTYPDRTSFRTGFGLFNFDLVESFLNWQSSFTRTEVLTDTADTYTPDLREYRNIFRTGPAISYIVSPAARLSLSANYINVENSDEDASDSERMDSNLVYTHTLNSITELTLNGQYGESIDADENDEYANANINAGFIRQFSRGELIFRYGRTELIPENADRAGGNFFDIQMTREQMMRHDISLQYQQDISETSIGFINDEQGNVLASDPLRSASTNDIVKRKRLFFSAERVIESYSYIAGVFLEEENYVSQKSDEKSRGVNFRVDRQISQGFTSGFEYTFRVNDFSDRPLVGKDNTSTYQLDSQYDLSEDFSVNSFIRFAARANGRNSVREYEVFSTGFSLSWALF